MESNTCTMLNCGVHWFCRISRQILPSLYTRNESNQWTTTIGVEEMIREFDIGNNRGITLWKLDSKEKGTAFPRCVIGPTTVSNQHCEIVKLLPHDAGIPNKHVIAMNATSNTGGPILLVIFIIRNNTLACLGGHETEDKKKWKWTRKSHILSGRLHVMLKQCLYRHERKDILAVLQKKQIMRWEC